MENKHTGTHTDVSFSVEFLAGLKAHRSREGNGGTLEGDECRSIIPIPSNVNKRLRAQSPCEKLISDPNDSFFPYQNGAMNVYQNALNMRNMPPKKHRGGFLCDFKLKSASPFFGCCCHRTNSR